MSGKFDAQQVAEFLTKTDLAILKSIQAQEFTNSENGRVAWVLPDRLTRSPNIIKAIERANQVSFWVITDILSYSTPEQRAKAIVFWIETVDALLDLLNYNSATSIIHALGHGSIDRLKQTWKLVPTDKLRRVSYFNMLISPPFQEYKRLTADLLPDWIPCLGVILHDIHHLEVMISNDMQKSESLESRDNILDRFISQISNTSYESLSEHTTLHEYYSNLKLLNSDEVYTVSRELEPKQTIEPVSEEDEVPTSSGLTSSPVFFYGVPALAIATIAATVAFLLFRKHRS